MALRWVTRRPLRLLRPCALSALTLASACANSFDTTRSPPPRGTVAQESFAAPATEGIVCAGCSEKLPPGAGICARCGYIVPLAQIPKAPAGRHLERRELIVNLLPQGIRWTPEGLQKARRLSADALRQATIDGWEPTSIGKPYQLVEGRTISGSVVESTILTLERLV